MRLMDVLNRLKWDAAYEFEDVIIYYEDRAEKELAFIKGRWIKKIGEKFIETERGYIPLHRIRRIEYRGRIIWPTDSS